MFQLKNFVRYSKDFRLSFVQRFGSYDIGIHDSERTRSVTSFYYQSAIDHAANKPVIRLMPSTMLYSGRSTDGGHLLRSAQYLHKELPVRIAHCITGFRQLPFIVGCNPTLLSVHELYISSFHLMSEFPPITDMKTEIRYSHALSKLLDDHKDVIKMLAEGFKETTKHISDEQIVKSFLDYLLTSRLAVRMLCEHHLSLHEERPNQIGIIFVHFSPKTFIEKKAEFTRKMCNEKYGVSPEVYVKGHVAATFPYIPQPLDYILNELLKNAMRSTVESHPHTAAELLPPVTVTIANNENDFILRISDFGGGIQHGLLKKIWNYGFTTNESDHSTNTFNESDSHSLFEELTENRTSGKFHGYGFGLPACKAFVEYLGGEIRLETMQGMGTDVYLRLSHIDGKMGSFRI